MFYPLIILLFYNRLPDELVNINKQHASRYFENGNYYLSRLDNFGQIIDIEIALPGIGEATGRTSYLKSGWMMFDGSIKLTKPFAGFIGRWNIWNYIVG